MEKETHPVNAIKTCHSKICLIFQKQQKQIPNVIKSWYLAKLFVHKNKNSQLQLWFKMEPWLPAAQFRSCVNRRILLFLECIHKECRYGVHSSLLQTDFAFFHPAMISTVDTIPLKKGYLVFMNLHQKSSFVILNIPRTCISSAFWVHIIPSLLSTVYFCLSSSFFYLKSISPQLFLASFFTPFQPFLSDEKTSLLNLHKY